MANIIELLSDNYYMDDSNLGISKDLYKSQAFEDTMSFKLENESSIYTEEFVNESIDLLDAIINNQNIIITQSDNVRYNNQPIITDENKTIIEITEHIENGNIALVYCSIPIESSIFYKTKLM